MNVYISLMNEILGKCHERHYEAEIRTIENLIILTNYNFHRLSARSINQTDLSLSNTRPKWSKNMNAIQNCHANLVEYLKITLVTAEDGGIVITEVGED